MDSRIDIYGPELYDEWAQARSSPDRFYPYLSKYHCTLIMLLGQPHRHIFEDLSRNPEWKLVLRTSERFVFARVSDL